jgi:UDP-2,3-diacylglucosamine pyrophosphatase LpxH
MRHGRLALLTLLAGLGLAWSTARLPSPGLRLSAALLGGAALALALDALLRRDRRQPLYRRHLAAGLLGLAAAALGGLRSGGYDFLIFAGGGFGAAFGLALSVAGPLRGRKLEAFSWVRGEARRQDPSRPLILVADPHWRDDLVGLARATVEHPEADWLFLGDVFDVWVGLPGMDTGGHRAFLAWVRARREAGRWVGLWLGNRDYFLDGLTGAFDLLGEGTGGGLPEEGLAFEHGDWINHGDWRYRLWNVLSRSGPMWLFFRILPGFLARRIAAGLERRLRTTNRAYKLAFPREAFEAAARTSGGRTFLTGHFHTLERAANGIALPWAFEGEFWVWRGGRAEPLEPASTSAPEAAP